MESLLFLRLHGLRFSRSQGQAGGLLCLGELQDATERDVLIPSWLRRCGRPQVASKPAGSSPQRLRRAKGTLEREVTDEVVRFLPPSSADLRSQHDEALRA